MESWDVDPAGSPLAADAVAIVGADCRFADVSGVDELWDALTRGRELISRTDAGASGRGVLERPEHFDAGLFGISPGEAELIDPQQRVFLECSWHALEHAGYDPGRFPGDIAVFAGVGRNTYLPFLRGRDVTTEQAMLVDYGNEKDFLATRVSYRLGLRGPAMTVQTGCSTSLAAVHLACQSLLNYECDMALAGGVSILAAGDTVTRTAEAAYCRRTAIAGRSMSRRQGWCLRTVSVSSCCVGWPTPSRTATTSSPSSGVPRCAMTARRKSASAPRAWTARSPRCGRPTRWRTSIRPPSSTSRHTVPAPSWVTRWRSRPCGPSWTMAPARPGPRALLVR